MKYCPKCGKEITDQKFCPECGTKIESSDNLSFDFSSLQTAATSQLYDKEGLVVENGVLTKYTGKKRNVCLPNTVEEIYDRAFENNDLITFVELPEGLKIIGRRAFANCKSLVKINIPSTVEKVYEDAFDNTSLETLIMANYSEKIIYYCLSNDAKKHFYSGINISRYLKNENGVIFDVKAFEKDAKAEKKRKEDEIRRIALENERAEQARRAEIERQENERRRVEEARRAEEKRKADAAKAAADAKRAEEERIEALKRAEIERQREEARRIEEARKAEERRKEEARRAEEKRKADAARAAEEARKQAAYEKERNEFLKRMAEEEEKDRKRMSSLMSMDGKRQIIKFGKYYITNPIFKSPIEWKILDTKGDRALVIATMVLDKQPYNQNNGPYAEVTWERCSLRSWLNDVFITKAFTKEEQELILETENVNHDNTIWGTPGCRNTIDKIFILSEKEYYHYFQDYRLMLCDKTPFAVRRRGFSNYWGRTPGKSPVEAYNIASSIRKEQTFSVEKPAGVRPAMWIKIK